MPLYDFRCSACGADFEVERPLGASGKVKCLKCSSVRTLKVFGAAGIVFRGSGFYVTDSKPGQSSQVKDGSAGDSPKSADVPAVPPDADTGGNATGNEGKGPSTKPAEYKPRAKAPAG
jgi:putative FmdB family regulatory protein